MLCSCFLPSLIPPLSWAEAFSSVSPWLRSSTACRLTLAPECPLFNASSIPASSPSLSTGGCASSETRVLSLALQLSKVTACLLLILCSLALVQPKLCAAQSPALSSFLHLVVSAIPSKLQAIVPSLPNFMKKKKQTPMTNVSCPSLRASTCRSSHNDSTCTTLLEDEKRPPVCLASRERHEPQVARTRTRSDSVRPEQKLNPGRPSALRPARTP